MKGTNINAARVGVLPWRGVLIFGGSARGRSDMRCVRLGAGPLSGQFYYLHFGFLGLTLDSTISNEAIA